MSRVRRARATSVAIAVTAFAARAGAQTEDPAAARAAYAKGAAAYDAQDYPRAASALARADELSPNPVALELALKAAVRADDPRLAMTLAERADERPPNAAVTQAAAAARAKMKDRVGRLTVECAPAVPCTATVDQEPFATGRARWLLAGPHVVVVDSGKVRERFAVRIEGEGSVDVRATAPALASLVATPKAPAPPAEGVPPVWFWVAAGASAALVTATVVSAIDTQSTHEAFVARPSADLARSGENAQLRTNVLGSVAATGLVATGLLGLFFVRWSAPSERTRARAD